MADIKNAYGAKTPLTMTLTGLVNNTGRESTVVDNTSDKFQDALVRIKANGLAGSTSVLRVFAYAALGDTTYTDGNTGSDAAAATVRNVVFVGAVTMNGATAVVGGMFSIAAAFGGTLPDKWGIVIVNNSGANLSAAAADFAVEYEGVYATVG